MSEKSGRDRRIARTRLLFFFRLLSRIRG
jgi:hypothetical protein